MGRRFMQVLWLVFMNLVSLYSFSSPSKLTERSSSERLYSITIFSLSTYFTVPSPSAASSTRLSCATNSSRPVPTMGASGSNRGTAWRIMLEPISARLASLCSKKGIKLAAMEAIWFGATSISSSSFGSTTGKSPIWRAFTRLPVNSPVSATWALAWAIIFMSSSSALR